MGPGRASPVVVELRGWDLPRCPTDPTDPKMPGRVRWMGLWLVPMQQGHARSMLTAALGVQPERSARKGWSKSSLGKSNEPEREGKHGYSKGKGKLRGPLSKPWSGLDRDIKKST